MTPPCRIPGFRPQARLPHSMAMMCQRGWPLQPTLKRAGAGTSSMPGSHKGAQKCLLS